MIPRVVEYGAMHLVRRHLFIELFLSRFGQILLFFRTNANQSNLGPVVDAYAAALKHVGPPVRVGSFRQRLSMEWIRC